MLWMLLAASLPAAASDTGLSGHAGGCYNCHGRTADPSTTVTLAASATTVAPGATVDLTLTLASSDAAHTHGGLDVAASGGTFTAGSNTRLESADITHRSPQPMASGAVVFDFRWTAPAARGTYRLTAAGNAVDDDGSDFGDGWNVASTLTLVVDDGCADVDADGVTDCDGDCDEADAAIFPGAPESCDGVDEDCDGVVDDAAVDATVWTTDADGDGYGDDATARAGCAPAAAEVETGGDCDDGDAAVHPGAAEVPYDGVDQDCADGDLADLDGDGALAAAAGGDDCDDGDAAVHPGAAEVPYDGVDQDCVGGDLIDVDGDGAAAVAAGGTDCDDTDPAVVACDSGGPAGETGGDPAGDTAGDSAGGSDAGRCGCAAAGAGGAGWALAAAGLLTRRRRR